MPEDAATLLRAALPFLQRYRAGLIESRSGAAAPREQEALEVGRLLHDIETMLARTEPDA